MSYYHKDRKRTAAFFPGNGKKDVEDCFGEEVAWALRTVKDRRWTVDRNVTLQPTCIYT